MKIESRFILATLLSAAAFIATGGGQAAEQAVQAEDSAQAGAETSIPFAGMGGIRDWRAVDERTLYVQDNQRNWYLAQLIAPCTDLPYATSIGFETRGTSQLDKFGSVVVNGQRCALSSFVASGPPPAKGKTGK